MIRVGTGGWTYEPWRGTFYGSQKPESFRKWRRETPDGFVFALKGPRFATNRRELLAEITDPVAIFGPGWQDANELTHHKRHPVRIDEQELAEIYARHIGVLNIRNGGLVINGLNQRHFAPYIQGTPVVTDAQPDIPHCFDPGDDILVYQDAAELRAIQARLRQDPAWAALIGVAGQRRVLAQHTYAHRLDTIAAFAGVNTTKPHR